MSKYFKLNDAIDVPAKLNVARKQNGITKYCHVTLSPGEKYDLEDDEVLEKSLKGAVYTKPYTIELENLLKHHGVEYKVDMCKTCGGRVKKLKYNAVDIVEVTDDE